MPTPRVRDWHGRRRADATQRRERASDPTDAEPRRPRRRRFRPHPTTVHLARRDRRDGGIGRLFRRRRGRAVRDDRDDDAVVGFDRGVPEAYATATSLDGTQRNPDSLSSQEAVSYQDEPSEGRQCSTCRYYIEDKNGDGVGACAIVAGEVDPEGYCVSYVEYEG